jgi:hypothetical protein
VPGSGESVRAEALEHASSAANIEHVSTSRLQ